MSEPCRRGHKCMCFQCSETDCERYEPEPPEWMLLEDEKFIEAMEELKNWSREAESNDDGGGA